jgi:putative addiction module component (TIGR02574 family)
MAHVTLRPQAELDILDIWEFIAADSIRAADQWVDDLDQNGDVAPGVLGVVDGASNEFGVGLRMYARRSPDGRACPGQSSFDGDVRHSAGFALRHSPVDFNGPCVCHLRVRLVGGQQAHGRCLPPTRSRLPEPEAATMVDPVAELADRARALGPRDRATLVGLLLESLDETPDPTVEAAWQAEIRRRIAAYERGEAVLHDEDDVLAELERIAP